MDTLRKLIREVIQLQKLEEINQAKLAGMYHDTVAKIEKLNPQTASEDIKEIQQDIQHIGSIDMKMAERLYGIFQDKKDKVDSIWGHMSTRTPMQGKRAPMPMPSHKRPRRNR
jgi:hypothetical protein